MTTPARIRRGLPRVPGGEAWPPADVGAQDAVPVGSAAGDAASVGSTAQDAGPRSDSPAAVPAAPAKPDASSPNRNPAPLRVRRGLPRVPGGEPWPPASSSPRSAAEVARVAASGEATRPDVPPSPAKATAVRRGLPRVAGGEPWPPADFVAVRADVPAPASAPAEAHAPASVPLAASVPPAEAATVPPVSVPSAPLAPLPFPQTVFPGAAAARWNVDRARTVPLARPEPVRVGPFTRLQWAGVVIVGGLGLLFAAGMLVLAVRWFVSLEFMRDFMATYPGEYHLPVGAPVGFPAWVGWQHFFNVFLMVLIIRSGLRVRSEKRPTAFWSRRGSKRKISLALWFHQSLDILWLVNGVVFVVLLFVTGQWLRIVPTSWEVFPNALTAALKYVSLNWPTEDGWVNYNALQQLAYFATVFLAAPLAAISGVRMSGVWPKNAKTLNRAYPVEWARAVHFPVMLYFVLFIIVHVALVLATGALRNLNHMYGGSDQVNWIGFWIFAASLAVIAAGWAAARPLVLAPIARLFGTVSGR
ncbi:MAG: cytochrome b/b6 domain-containing protein [Microbacterium sp.]|nr:cytochrome b/b6 domain-containing protein [Microbacterium sp.]